MRLRLLLTGLSVAVGACDAASSAPVPDDADTEAAHVADADSVSSADALDAASPADTAPPADAAQRADVEPQSDAALAPLDAAAPVADTGPSWPLGMNDVTILAPLPASMTTPVLLRGTDPAQDGTPLVPKELFDRIGEPACKSGTSVTCSGERAVLFSDDYENLHLVAVRFALCDRNQPGACTAGEDGSLRLVWQPMRGNQAFDDVGVHAMFAIPNAQLPSAVGALRELAQLQAAPVSAPLTVSPALSDPTKPAYAEKLRAFVRAYALRSQLLRLAINAQPAQYAQVRWVLRGVERGADGAFHDIVIPGSEAVQQEVILRGLGFEATPSVNLPTGFDIVLSQSVFQELPPDAQLAGLTALVATDHPLKVAPGTAPCVSCHTATLLFKDRVNPAAPAVQEILRSDYVTTYDVSLGTGGPLFSGRTLRALGYLFQTPVISRRVAHETAQVLTEIAQRFP